MKETEEQLKRYGLLWISGDGSGSMLDKLTKKDKKNLEERIGAPLRSATGRKLLLKRLFFLKGFVIVQDLEKFLHALGVSKEELDGIPSVLIRKTKLKLEFDSGVYPFQMVFPGRKTGEIFKCSDFSIQEIEECYRELEEGYFLKKLFSPNETQTEMNRKVKDVYEKLDEMLDINKMNDLFLMKVMDLFLEEWEESQKWKTQMKKIWREIRKGQKIEHYPSTV